MKAMKGNRITAISERDKGEFLRNGYAILNDDEKIIEQPLSDAADLRRQIESLKETIAEKNAEIATLNAEIAKSVTGDAKTVKKQTR